MYSVSYDYRIQYRHLPGNPGMYPVLDVQLSRGNLATNVVAIVDTGAQRSLISGEHPLAMGIDIASGSQQRLYTLSGSILTWKHPVRVQVFELLIETELCFSEFRLPRNILGRDMQEMLELGFSEHYSTLFVSPTT